MWLYFLFYWFCRLNTLNTLTGTCYSGSSLIYSYFRNNIFLPVRLIVVFIIPFIIMCLANILVSLKINWARVWFFDETRTNSAMISNQSKIFSIEWIVTVEILISMISTLFLTMNNTEWFITTLPLRELYDILFRQREIHYT